MSAVVEHKTASAVIVRNCEDGERWKVPYHRIKLDARDFEFNQRQGQLDRNSLAVGDRVGFAFEGQQITGIVERLNAKTVSLKNTTDHKKWRVPYSFLYAVIEGEAGAPLAGALMLNQPL